MRSAESGIYVVVCFVCGSVGGRVCLICIVAQYVPKWATADALNCGSALTTTWDCYPATAQSAGVKNGSASSRKQEQQKWPWQQSSDCRSALYQFAEEDTTRHPVVERENMIRPSLCIM